MSSQFMNLEDFESLGFSKVKIKIEQRDNVRNLMIEWFNELRNYNIKLFDLYSYHNTHFLPQILCKEVIRALIRYHPVTGLYNYEIHKHIYNELNLETWSKTHYICLAFPRIHLGKDPLDLTKFHSDIYENHQDQRTIWVPILDYNKGQISLIQKSFKLNLEQRAAKSKKLNTKLFSSNKLRYLMEKNHLYLNSIAHIWNGKTIHSGHPNKNSFPTSSLIMRTSDEPIMAEKTMLIKELPEQYPLMEQLNIKYSPILYFEKLSELYIDAQNLYEREHGKLLSLVDKWQLAIRFASKIMYENKDILKFYSFALGNFANSLARYDDNYVFFHLLSLALGNDSITSFEIIIMDYIKKMSLNEAREFAIEFLKTKPIEQCFYIYNVRMKPYPDFKIERTKRLSLETWNYSEFKLKES